MGATALAQPSAAPAVALKARLAAGGGPTEFLAALSHFLAPGPDSGDVQRRGSVEYQLAVGR